jgi:Cu-Zn family superoxide dismutase
VSGITPSPLALTPRSATARRPRTSSAGRGDLPNLVVGKDGKAKATFTAKGATLGEGKGSLFGSDGTALVIHADADDEKPDPAGNSPGRIACGVIEKK